MKYSVALLILLHTCSTMQAQQTIGIKLNGGLSNIVERNDNGQALKHIFYLQPSYHAGIYYSIHLPHQFNFGSEVLFIKINGKQYTGIPYTDNNNNPTGEYSSDTVWRHFSYVGLPLYIGYSYKKLNVNLGVQANVRLGGHVRDKGSALSNGDTIRWENKSKNLNGIDKVDMGLKAGFIVDIHKGFALEATYYYGLNNLYREAFTNWKLKSRQCTVGLRYTCYMRNKKTALKK